MPRQYFGAKWDLDEYFDEDPRGDDFKVYSKHLSVLYRSTLAQISMDNMGTGQN